MPNWCLCQLVSWSGQNSIEAIQRLRDDIWGVRFMINPDSNNGLARLTKDPPPWFMGEPLEDIPAEWVVSPGSYLMARTLGHLPHQQHDRNSMVDSFGTRSDFSVEPLGADDTEGTLILNFETAWSPPLGWLEIIAREYALDFKLYFDEPGADFAGIAVTSSYNNTISIYSSDSLKFNFMRHNGDLGQLHLADYLEPEDIAKVAKASKDWPTDEAGYLDTHFELQRDLAPTL